MRVALVVNPSAGPAARRRQALEERVRRAALEAGLSAEVAVTSAPGHAEILARRAAGRFPVVVAIGGDGTVNEVARGLLGTTSALGVVPLGTGNGFARDFGISLDLGRAFAQLRSGRPRPIDVGEVDGRLFLMAAGFGVDAYITRRFHLEAGGRRGQLPYFRIGLEALFSYRPPRLELDVAGEAREVEPLLLVAANTRQFGGGAVVAPHALPDDGRLDFVLVPRLGAARALLVASKLFSGTLDRARGVEILRAPFASLAAAGPIEAQLDGEPVTLGRAVSIRCRERALTLWSPG